MASALILRQQLERELVGSTRVTLGEKKLRELAEMLISAGEVNPAVLKTAGILLLGNSSALVNANSRTLEKLVLGIHEADVEESVARASKKTEVHKPGSQGMVSK